MNIVKKNIEELIPYVRNARTHSDAQVAEIAASIREFGFMNPVLIDGKNNIIAGHGRVLAARKLGMEEVPCVLHEHLTDTQRKAYILADNKLSLNAGWDEELLKIELQELSGAEFNVALTGFDLSDIGDEYINHCGEQKAGASPWERMSGGGKEGVVFSFGSITTKLSEDVYQLFKDHVPDQDLSSWLEGVIVNAFRNS